MNVQFLCLKSVSFHMRLIFLLVAPCVLKWENPCTIRHLWYCAMRSLAYFDMCHLEDTNDLTYIYIIAMSPMSQMVYSKELL